MSLSESLSDLLSKALLAIHNHSNHDLNLGYRQAIWSKLGTNNTKSDFLDSVGHKRRALLAISTARKVISIWNKTWPTDNRPSFILAKAEEVINGATDGKKAAKFGDEFWTLLEHHIGEDNNISIYAGTSAVKALFVAVQDEQFDESNIDYQRTDADVDVYDLDTSYFAAAAYAHGSIWEPDSDPAKRREFWEWWLQEAVPAAWRSMPS